MRRTVSIAAVIVASVLNVLVPIGSTSSAAAKAQVAPNPAGLMDCNGWSPKYQSIRPAMRGLCTDPIKVAKGGYSGSSGDNRVEDNGHYVGHDEPSARFISTASGSGNSMTYFMQLPSDPSSGTDYAELSSAPWFGMPLCDPNSDPFGGCTKDSDSNTPGNAGAAVMELQFYPPGFGPFVDGISCDSTRWCAALNIDSFECSISDITCQGNSSCLEPVNFAYLTLDGQPTGPPNPQQSNLQTMLPNSDTLFLTQGDTLRVTINDTTSGVMTRVDDFSSGQSGFMTASGANGFKNTDPNSCAGSPFDFHPEFDTAKVANIMDWPALDIGIAAAQEIGHFEPCGSISNGDSASLENFPSGFSDPAVRQTCAGSSEVSNNIQNGAGEGPCTNVFCSNLSDVGETEGGAACNVSSGLPCEFADAYCLPAGARSVTVGSGTQTWSWPVDGCEANQFQNGDLDFDGTSYQTDWPDGGGTHPKSVRMLGPFDAAGNLYPQVQFETDMPGSEANCNTTSGSGCDTPPASPTGSGSAFYPFWSLENSQQPTGLHPTVSNACVWNFGDDNGGVTTNDFSKDAEYGSPQTPTRGGTLVSSAQTNPPSPCPSLNLGQADPATQLLISPSSGTRTPGAAFPVAVTAIDASGFASAGFTDTVAFSSNDGAASLPPPHPFNTTERGVYPTLVTLNSGGLGRTITVTDMTNGAVGAITGSFNVEIGAQQDVFWRDPSGDLDEIWYVGGAWHGPLDLTASFFGGAAPLQSAPSAEMLPDGSQQLVFWQGPGGHLFEAWYSGGWHGPVDLSATYLGGPVMQSAPSARVLPDGSQQLVFWEGPGNHVDEAWYAGGSWHGPVDLSSTYLGGASPLQSAPSAQVLPDGSQQLVFWQGSGNHLDEAWYAGGSWHGPVDLSSTYLGGAAPLQSSPSAAVLPDGTQQLVFWEEAGGGLTEAWYAGGGWHGPLDLTNAYFGGAAPLQSAPSATVLPDGTQQLAFWQGPGAHLFEAWYAGGSWHGPVDWTASLGAPVMTSAPSAAIEPIF